MSEKCLIQPLPENSIKKASQMRRLVLLLVAQWTFNQAIHDTLKT